MNALKLGKLEEDEVVPGLSNTVLLQKVCRAVCPSLGVMSGRLHGRHRAERGSRW